MRRAEAARAMLHQPCRCGGEQGRDQLIGENAIARQQADRGEDREQADRLAIPYVDIGQGAVEQAVADEQIILLVDMDHRVAEIDRTHGERDHQQQRRDHALRR